MVCLNSQCSDCVYQRNPKGLGKIYSSNTTPEGWARALQAPEERFLCLSVFLLLLLCSLFSKPNKATRVFLHHPPFLPLDEAQWILAMEIGNFETYDLV